MLIISRQYQKVPKLRRDDNIIPSISEIPTLLTSIRHPRSRAVSIGPQSEADVYETLAYREKRRRDSKSAGQGRSLSTPKISIDTTESGFNDNSRATEDMLSDAFPRSSKLSEYEHMMGSGLDSIPNSAVVEEPSVTFDVSASEPLRREQGEKEMFERLQRPRVRYDVEVVTKLIVYAGKCPVDAIYSAVGNVVLIESRNWVARGRDQSNAVRNHWFGYERSRDQEMNERDHLSRALQPCF